uniref:Uncharacterized protein n=1 Tax=Pseudictyota dubia TaxID=2749911 RepID=A0A7R9VXB3_9STRA
MPPFSYEEEEEEEEEEEQHGSEQLSGELLVSATLVPKDAADEEEQQQQQQVVRPTSAAEEVGAALPHLHHYQQQEHPQQHLHTLADDDDGRDREAQLQARAERIAPYIEALSAAQSDLARDSVFVFLQDSSEGGSGRVLALPSGACVLDALREGERRFGVSVDWRDRSRGRGRGHSVEYNGEVSNVTERLHNGDVVMVRSIRRQQQQQPVSL